MSHASRRRRLRSLFFSAIAVVVRLICSTVRCPCRNNYELHSGHELGARPHTRRLPLGHVGLLVRYVRPAEKGDYWPVASRTDVRLLWLGRPVRRDKPHQGNAKSRRGGGRRRGRTVRGGRQRTRAERARHTQVQVDDFLLRTRHGTDWQRRPNSEAHLVRNRQIPVRLKTLYEATS